MMNYFLGFRFMDNKFNSVILSMSSPLRILTTILCLVCASNFAWTTNSTANLQTELIEVANGDAQFWLHQGPPNNRYMPCSVYYYFDEPVDASLLLEKLKTLASSYTLFNLSVVDVDGLPYWQSSNPDWNTNFRILESGESLEMLREASDRTISQPAAIGQGLPLFRAYLSHDRRQFLFMWHHVLSDYEGMFNKHALHIFGLDHERTQFGYQMASEPSAAKTGRSVINKLSGLLTNMFDTERSLGFEGTGFNVKKIVLPIDDQALGQLAERAGLGMSDIFSFIALRSVTRYHESLGEPLPTIRPVLSPLSLRKSALDIGEGNNRTIKTFPVLFPLESIEDMHSRLLSLAPASSSYDDAGKFLKAARTWQSIEPLVRRLGMPDYISNYFPLSDSALAIGSAKVTGHFLRVPMVPYERSKFAWSNYDGAVQLFLQTDPKLIDEGLMFKSFEQASTEILVYLARYTAK
jgi:hypothetical protein